MYYRGAQAAIVVYDVTSTDTFARAKTWVKELQRQANPNIVIALAGNKADLASKRTVDQEVSAGNLVWSDYPIYRALFLPSLHQLTILSFPVGLATIFVEHQEASAYAEDNGLLFMETSAKTAKNVNEIFLAIAKKLPKNDQRPGGGGGGGVVVGKDSEGGKKGCC